MMRGNFSVLVVAFSLSACGYADPSIETETSAVTISWHTVTSTDIQQPVEQQTADWDTCWTNPSTCDPALWISNPYTQNAAATVAEVGQPGAQLGCPWDVDDTGELYAEGRLSAGQSTSVTTCLVGDGDKTYSSPCPAGSGYPPGTCYASWGQKTYYSTAVAASSNTLHVTLCYDGPYARCFTPQPVYDSASKQWLYKTCTMESYTYSDPVLGTIANSNGGVGIVEHLTYTITNTDAHGNITFSAFTGETLSADTSYDGAGGGCSALATSPPVNYSYPYMYLP